MSNQKLGSWIWIDAEQSENQYGEFYTDFYCDSEECFIKLSCDGDYTLFVNGRFVGSNQYGDYEHYKIYDVTDISSFIKKGNNSLAVLVWHFGKNSQRYINYDAGLNFVVFDGNGKELSVSNESVLSRQSRAYFNGPMKYISLQLGVGFKYDATQEDNWINGELKGFSKSRLVNKNCTFFPRPNNKLELLPFREGRLIKNDLNTRFIFDMGEEIVGLVGFKFRSDKIQNVKISYGEDLQNGHVRRIIEDRDFSVDYVAVVGCNEYTNYMLRLGCRYLEIECESPISDAVFGIVPQIYPTEAVSVKLDNELDGRIYDICQRSIKLCMMEHYVDCPWREQALYCFDSRNQMLCGYYAFKDGNFQYVRSNLKLISMDRRADKMLSICFPCGVDLTIPSFSLYYLLQMKEYTEYSGDVTLANEVFPKLFEIIALFNANRKDGLINSFENTCHWNFYDWTESCSGYSLGTFEPDLILNSLFVIALDSFEYICKKTGNKFDYEKEREEIVERSRAYFYDKETGLYDMYKDRKIFTVLANSLAIIAGIVPESQRSRICERFNDGSMEACSLSMKSFKYDAMLIVSEDYRDAVLEEIRNDYTVMLENGATSTWETIDGARAFNNAGSLCHGWTGIPIYYYNKFGLVKRT